VSAETRSPLDEYGRHHAWCATNDDVPGECSCGFAAELAKQSTTSDASEDRAPEYRRPLHTDGQAAAAVLHAAIVAHEANRAYCVTLNDSSQKPWKDAPEWQRQSALNGARAVYEAYPNVRPEASHDGWMREKLAAGWTYGPVKDEVKKTHPCLVPFADLPRAQQAKDALFVHVCIAVFNGAGVV
jgi:hypothetical protein